MLENTERATKMDNSEKLETYRVHKKKGENIEFRFFCRKYDGIQIQYYSIIHLKIFVRVNFDLI